MTQARLVGGRYELGELIGYGGMAEVHRGRDSRLGREVAIKVLRADLARDPSFLARFRREAQAAAGLNHPSIVSVYDTGEDIAADGSARPYIVMEYVEGRTLRDILKAEGHLPVRRAMEVAAEVCGALDFSHRNGIVHRDIKPANVMITPTGAVKVMDFGIARAVADNAATVTQTANVIGTAQYLSPEQARGEAVDARSDVYSTGCLLYELVTGSPPFQGDSPVAVAYQHVRENAAPPSSRNPEVPPALDSIVMKALAKNQLNRYQSAGEMRSDLQRALANQPVAAEAVMTDAERTQFIARTPPPPVGVPLRGDYGPEEPGSSRRTGLIWVAIVVALLLVIGAAAYAIVFLGKDKATPMVAVPTLTNEKPTAAITQLQSLGFIYKNAGTTNGPCDDGKTVAEGNVCTQDPQSDGTVKAKKGSLVSFSTYTEKKVQVPSVTTENIGAAQTALHTAGLTATAVVKQVNNAAVAGTVLVQDPPAFAVVAPDTPITLQVSTGKLVLPSVVGQKPNAAQQQLQSQGWTNVVVDTTDTVTTTDKTKDGLVASQTPDPNVAYSLNTAIVLKVWKYQQPCTTPPPSTPSSPASGSSSSSGAPSSPGSSSSSAASSPNTMSSSPGLPACPSNS